MRITRHKFDKVSIKGVRRWKDENGKPRQETREFSQTVNPFNTTAGGLVKTPQQIMVEIKRERELWLAQSK